MNPLFSVVHCEFGEHKKHNMNIIKHKVKL